MTDDPPQDKHRSEPQQADHPNDSRGGDSTNSGVDPSVMQSSEVKESGEGARAAPMQDADHALEQASDEAQMHENTSHEPSEISTAKESVQLIPLTLPQGGNPTEHLTPEQLSETNASQRRTREVAIQSPGAVPVKEPVRYDTVLFAPKVAPALPSDAARDDNAKPVGQSPFQMSGPESSDAQSIADLEMPELPSSKTDKSAGSEIAPEGADPALPSNEASGEQRLPRRGDSPPWARAQFDNIVQLSDPHSDSAAVAASGGSNVGTAPPQSSSSTTAQTPPTGEKAAPLPRVIVMVSLDDAERIVHEEMRVFSRELAIVGRQIAQEETENLMFDFRAQINALLG
jgi:hypothetical protein